MTKEASHRRVQSAERATHPGRVLIVDDDRATCELLNGALSRRGFEVTLRTSNDELPELESCPFDVVFTDLNIGGVGGLELCKRVVATRLDVPVVLATAFGSLEAAVGAIRAGAYDFITRPFEIEAAALMLERAVRHRALGEEVKRLRRAVGETQRYGEMIGVSADMCELYDLIARVAETDASVLVTGESGTGKELVARAVHAASRRSKGPFVAINCAAMPEPLLESELFGHVKGAFTDAHHSRSGLFVKATDGTLLLDEIGDMPPGMQAKLLRVLQERTVRPVGSDVEVPFDTRIIAATNRDLEIDVKQKRFREDLFYRVNVVKIAVPPLRSRAGDVLLLAQGFLERFALLHGCNVKGFSRAAAERLMSYRWPGNVRELQNCIERAVALARFEMLGVDDLPENLRQYAPVPFAVDGDDLTDLPTMSEVERRYILRVLDTLGGNKTRAAEVLGLDRRTLYRKLDAYGVAAAVPTPVPPIPD